MRAEDFGKDIGERIAVTRVLTSGEHIDAYGNGSTGIELQVQGRDVAFMHICTVEFTQPNSDQVLDMATAPWPGEGGMARATSMRRVSQAQAYWLRQEIAGHLAQLLENGAVPSDEELGVRQKVE